MHRNIFHFQQKKTIFILFFFLAVSQLSFSYTPSEQPSAYEALQRYGFPVGLLPKGVKGYELDPGTGKFSAHLNETCRFTLERGYELEYETTVEGVIKEKKVENLKGVKVKVMMVWLNIAEVVRDGDELRFSVGVVGSAGFPVKNFEECPECGCGLDCHGESKSDFL